MRRPGIVVAAFICSIPGKSDRKLVLSGEKDCGCRSSQRSRARSFDSHKSSDSVNRFYVPALTPENRCGMSAEVQAYILYLLCVNHVSRAHETFRNKFNLYKHFAAYLTCLLVHASVLDGCANGEYPKIRVRFHQKYLKYGVRLPQFHH